MTLLRCDRGGAAEPGTEPIGPAAVGKVPGRILRPSLFDGCVTTDRTSIRRRPTRRPARRGRGERGAALIEFALAFPILFLLMMGVVDFGVNYEPADVAQGLGGDWYDAIPMADGSLVVIMGDIVGHGVEAVASMARLQHLITGLIRTGTPLEEVFERADAMARASDAIFATSVLLHLDTTARRLGVLSAGHPWPVLRTPDGTVHLLKGGRQALIGASMRPTEMQHLDLPPGSVLLAYTDGLIERRSEGIETSIERLADHLAIAGEAASADAILEHLVTLVAQADDDTATTDDIAAVVVRTAS